MPGVGEEFDRNMLNDGQVYVDGDTVQLIHSPGVDPPWSLRHDHNGDHVFRERVSLGFADLWRVRLKRIR